MHRPHPRSTLFPYTTLFRSSYLRWIMGQCTRVHMRVEPEGTVANFYARIARKKGDQKAIVPSGSTLIDRKSTRLNSSHRTISYAVFCLKKKKKTKRH